MEDAIYARWENSQKGVSSHSVIHLCSSENDSDGLIFLHEDMLCQFHAVLWHAFKYKGKYKQALKAQFHV